MLIKKISLKNIRSYESVEVEFPHGSVVLSGDIGSGKTSILIALEFALFGLQPGQKGSSILRNGKNEGQVTLEIEIDGKSIIIERGLKRSKSVNQSEVFIEVDGFRKEMSITESKNFILELLNYPSEFAKKTNLLYKFTVYTPQEEMKQIILEDSETRLDTLRHIFGIDKYKKVIENAELYAGKLRENIRNYEGQLEGLEDINKKLKSRQEMLKNLGEKLNLDLKELEEKKAERQKKESELKEVEERMKEKERYEKEAEKTRVMLTGKNEMISRLEKETGILKKEIEEAKLAAFDISELEKQEIFKKQKEEDKERETRKYFEILSSINAINSKLKDMEKIKEQIAKLELCPTCLQNVDENYKNKIMNKFKEDSAKFLKNIDETNKSRTEISKLIEAIKKELDELDKRIFHLRTMKIKMENSKEKEKRAENLEKQKKELEVDVKLLEEQIFLLKESVLNLQKYGRIYETKDKELKVLMKTEKDVEIKVAETMKEREIVERDIKEIMCEIEKKEKLKEKMFYLKEIEGWLSETFLLIVRFTEKNIMLKLREEFSKLFNEWFNILVPDVFSVHLDEDFTPVIEQQDYQLDYSFLSGGERTAIALAYRLALNQTINSLLSRIKTREIVILDEPTDGFSEQQLDKMRDVLNELNVKQLIIVSHEAKIESFVENIIKFKKEAGLSVVEK